MKKAIYCIVISICTSFTALGASIALARSQGAILGNPQFGKEAACFVENRGGPIRVDGEGCDGSRSWVIPIIYDRAGDMTIRITAQGSDSGRNNVSCRAYSATSGGYTYAGLVTAESRTTRNDGRTEYLKVSVRARDFGGTWVTCKMEPGTRLYNVLY